MDTAITSARPTITLEESAPRVTPTKPKVAFGEMFARSAVRGAEAAMNVLPGAPLMAAAVRGGSPASLPGAAMPGGSLPGAAPALPGLSRAAGSQTMAAEGPTALGQPQAGANGSLEGALQQSQDMNLYYLQVQESVNAQNRSFTTLSNVLKAEHDTVKTAIGNIR